MLSVKYFDFDLFPSDFVLCYYPLFYSLVLLLTIVELFYYVTYIQNC